MKFITGIFSFLSVFSAINCLSWSKTYTLQAVLHIPSADIEEPYKIWTDGYTGNSRIDFYDGLDKVYRLRASPDSFLYYKIHPESFDDGQSHDVCDVYNSTNDSVKKFMYKHYLPEVNFILKGRYPVGDIVTEKWGYEYIDKSDGIDLHYSYIVWVKSENSINIPVRYEYRTKVEGTVMNYIYHDYLYFNTTKPDPAIFEIPSYLDCQIRTAELHEPLDPIMEYVNPALEDERVSRAFDSFMLEHNKNYKDKVEYRERQHLFKNNLRLINSVNRQHKSYSLSLNQFADLSDNELANFNGLRVLPTNFSEYVGDVENFGNDSNNFDWRDYNAVSPIKDQTILCGSCYAFTAAATIESTRFIYCGCKGQVEEVSEQAIIDCSWRSAGKKANNGCDSGYLYYTLSYIKKNGVPTSDSYGPYLAMEGICRIKSAGKISKISDYIQIPKYKTKIKEALRNNGPLAIAVNGNPKTFMFYSRGIYDNEQCANKNTDLSHGVTLIGYGEKGGKEYWILKNSYGTKWGKSGFMRIATKSNICGVMNTAYGVRFKRKKKINKCLKKK